MILKVPSNHSNFVVLMFCEYQLLISSGALEGTERNKKKVIMLGHCIEKLPHSTSILMDNNNQNMKLLITAIPQKIF